MIVSPLFSFLFKIGTILGKNDLVYSLKKAMKNYFLVFLCLGLSFGACNNEDDTPIIEEKEQEEVIESVELENEINDFVWAGLNSWYLWQDEVSLSRSRHASAGQRRASHCHCRRRRPAPSSPAAGPAFRRGVRR